MPTNRLTTAAMNIMGLRIKTVRSNFEMFGLVSCYTFLKNMLHKLVAHFAEVVRPLESVVDSCYTFLEGCYTDLPRNSCRDVESIQFESNVALFGKAFALVCFVFLFSVHVCFG